MPSICFQRENIQIEVPAGTSVLDAARSAGVSIESPCGGAGTCGKCAVLLRAQDAQASCPWRRALACKTRVEDGMVVQTIPREQNDTMKIVQSGVRAETTLRPAVAKRYDAVRNRTELLFDGETAGFEEGNTAGLLFGASVDIGTTTLVVSLVDLRNGSVAAAESSLNPQSVFAQDVLSRISMAGEDGGLAKLYRAVTDAVNALILSAAGQAGADPARIYEAVYSGNTCMLHLAANVSPVSLGAYPYTPQITGGVCIAAKELELGISPFGRVVLPPILSAYVGADITAGLLAVRLYEKKGTTLFVDIGTNGEMVVARDGRLFATSTAAGPAFEGMNIACGMRAANGAVEFFEIAPDGGVDIRTIGNTKATGICGSGLLDIAAELVTWGVITPSGRFVKDTSLLPDELACRLEKREGKTVFSIADGVWLTQKDVRQIQLAKGAIRAGIECLLKSVDVAAGEVDEVLIAGSFGFHLRAKSLLAIGLLPPAFAGRIRFVGNTSKSGGEALLLDANLRDEIKRVSDAVDVMELGNYPGFQDLFVQCLNF